MVKVAKMLKHKMASRTSARVSSALVPALLPALMAMGLGLGASAAQADMVHYDVSRSPSNGGYSQSNRTLGSGDDTLHVSAWYGASAATNQLSNVSSDIEEYGGGLGIYRYSAGERCSGSNQQQTCQHTIDNADGYEYLAIESKDQTPFSLTQVRFEWTNTEADFSILALQDNKSFSRVSGTTSRSNFDTVASVAGNTGSWNPDQGGTYDLSSITTPNNAPAITASVWLIAAFNPNLSGGTVVGSPDDGSYTDGFKLAALKIMTGSTPTPGNGGGNGGGEVPAPAPLGLLALGLLALTGRGKHGKRMFTNRLTLLRQLVKSA